MPALINLIAFDKFICTLRIQCHVIWIKEWENHKGQTTVEFLFDVLKINKGKIN